MKLTYICEKEMLIKEYFKYVGLSQKKIKRIRALDNIIVNGQKTKNYFMIHVGDVLELDFPDNLNDDIVSVKYDLDIVYEDEYFIVVNKDRSVASQPTRSHQLDNLVSYLKNYFLENNINSNIHLVNRLDYSTSGLILISKSGIGHYEMTKTKITKKYLCKVKGKLDYNSEYNVIDAPIKREPVPSILRYVSDDGVKAITKYKVLESNDLDSIVECELVTGRCHQIRVHMNHINHPIIGDKLYNSDFFSLKDEENVVLYLHSYYLSFIHPFTKEKIELIKYPDWYNK